MNNKLIIILFCLICQTGMAQDEQPDKESTTTPAQSEQSKDKENDFHNDMAVAFGEKSVERQASEKEFATWGMQLNEHLLASEDDFSQAMALAKILSGIENARLLAKMHDKQQQVETFNDLSYQPLADLLNQLIAKPELSAASMDILSAICFKPDIQDYCHANVLLEKRMQQDGTNLQAYLRPFALAEKANNRQTMQQLIQLMAASQHSRSPLGISDKMASLIDAFITNNPIPQAAIDNMISDYQQLSGISPAKKAQLDELIPDYIPVFVKFSYKYLNDVPPYKTVLDYCQVNLAALDYCRDISEVMIQKSNTMIDKGVGHSLLIASYELARDQAGIEAAQQLNDKFRSAYECVRDLSKDQYFMDSYFDPEYQKIIFNSKDELETSQRLAEWRYQNLMAQGDETAVNPDSCFNVQSN